MSPRGVSTIVLDRHVLVREGLISLISHFGFNIVGEGNDSSELEKLQSPPPGTASLVILGSSYDADHAITQATRIRQLWPDAKIVLLSEHICLADIQKLLDSPITAYIPLAISRDVLIKALDLALNGVRIMMTNSEAAHVHLLAHKDQAGGSNQNGQGPDHDPVSRDDQRESVPHNCGPKLSKREIQILDGLMRGHANKIIARSCDITEATVKVHMKSILRKIQVSNRTQAAVWALANGHSANDLNDRLSAAAQG